MSVSIETIQKLQDNVSIRKEFGIDVRWRILTMKGGIARIVPYQDSRDVQNVLDSIVGPTNWTNEPSNINGKLYQAIGINVVNEGQVDIADLGIESDIEAIKGESSDAFKRAAVMWGIFRDVYTMDYVVLKTDGKYPVTDDGEILKTPEAINYYCNSISAPMGLLKKFYNLTKHQMKYLENSNVMDALKTLTEFTKTL